MRIRPLILIASFIVFAPAAAMAQAPAQARWEVALGPHLTVREGSSSASPGGGVTVARRYGRVSLVFEASGTRRGGHNDWRALGGPRATFGSAGKPSLFVQALAGTLIRQRAADWAVLPGIGIDVPWAETRAVRVQLDAPIERSQSRTATSIRGSIWLVF